jgi:hypothetical protein
MRGNRLWVPGAIAKQGHRGRMRTAASASADRRRAPPWLPTQFVRLVGNRDGANVGNQFTSLHSSFFFCFRPELSLGSSIGINIRRLEIRMASVAETRVIGVPLSMGWEACAWHAEWWTVAVVRPVSLALAFRSLIKALHAPWFPLTYPYQSVLAHPAASIANGLRSAPRAWFGRVG